MANHKSAWKRHLQSEKRRARNKATKSALRTVLKKARADADAGKASPTSDSVKDAVRALSKAGQKGVLHPRTAARRASRLMKAAAKKA